jgi:hypothetical protein
MRLCWDTLDKLDLYLTSHGNLYSRKYRTTFYEKICPICEEHFLARRRRDKSQGKTTNETCSPTCRTIYSKSFSCIDRNGYKRIFDHNKRAWRLEHVVKTERVLGRPLKKGEVVHHVNGDPSDNDNRNLLICKTGYHHFLHHRMSRRYASSKFPSYKEPAYV